MAIVAQCTNCGKKYKVAETSVGKHVRCQACQTTFIVQTPVAVAAGAKTAGGATAARPGQTNRSATASSASSKQMELAQRYGLASLPPNENTVFSEVPFKRPANQQDPLANHVVYEPGFSSVSEADYHATQVPQEQSMHDYMKQIEDEENQDKKKAIPDGPLPMYVMMGATPLVIAIIAGVVQILIGGERGSQVFGLGIGLFGGLLGLAVTLKAVLDNDDLTQLLLCWFVPFYLLYYTIVNWSYMKHPFFANLLFSASTMVGVVIFFIFTFIGSMFESDETARLMLQQSRFLIVYLQ